MSSSWGKKNHSKKDPLVGYDDFRSGLTMRDAWAMLRDESEDRADWRYKRRRIRLRLLHKLKLELYHRVVDGMHPSEVRKLARQWREDRLARRRRRYAERRMAQGLKVRKKDRVPF